MIRCRRRPAEPDVSRILALFLVLLSCVSAAGPASAQEPPRCTPEVDGALACMAGQSCRCGFARGGLLTAQPDGWRWDCGILRGRCGEALVQTPQALYELPPGLVIDQSDSSLHLDQTTGVNGSGQQVIDRSVSPVGSGPRNLFPGRNRPDGRHGHGRPPPLDAPLPDLRFKPSPDAF